MGFFKKIRRRIKKLIPKEVRSYAPYIAAAFAPPGTQGLFASTIGNQFMAAAATKAATDDEANLKDILRTGAFAAAPAAINKGITSLANPAGGPNSISTFLNKGRAVGDTGQTRSYARTLEGKLNPSGFMGNAKMVGVQGTADVAIKAKELNEDALAKYNADLAAQGINDKAGRRAAIRQIYANTGTSRHESNSRRFRYSRWSYRRRNWFYRKISCRRLR